MTMDQNLGTMPTAGYSGSPGTSSLPQPSFEAFAAFYNQYNLFMASQGRNQHQTFMNATQSPHNWSPSTTSPCGSQELPTITPYQKQTPNGSYTSPARQRTTGSNHTTPKTSHPRTAPSSQPVISLLRAGINPCAPNFSTGIPQGAKVSSVK